MAPSTSFAVHVPEFAAVRLLFGWPCVVHELDVNSPLLRQELLHALVDGAADRVLLSARAPPKPRSWG